MERKCGSQEPSVVLHSIYIQILPINLIFSLNWKFHQKSKFQPLLVWILGLIRDELGLNGGENVIFKKQKWYYIISMYKYSQLTFFLFLIGKFDQKSNFQPLLAWIRPYKSRMGLN